MPKQKILVADDDPGIQKLLHLTLEGAGYQVYMTSDGLEALGVFEQETLDLIILDILMPGIDGFTLCQRIRESSDTPIIMLTAMTQEKDMLQGLESGADDYIIKPFSIDVLVARVQAVLRRTKFPEDMPRPPFRSGELEIDFGQHRVSVAGKEVNLTATEYKLFSLLVNNANRVLTQDQLLEKVWGTEYRGERHMLQVAIARLRQKIGDDPRNPRYINTKVGIGYALTTPGNL